MPCCKHGNVDARKDKAKHHSIATQRYLPYAIWHKIWQGYGIRHSITISLYNDITIERCIQKAGMMRENAKAKITLHSILSKCDSLQKSPMPIHYSFHSTQSCANLAPRLLQAGCIILYCLLRLITSHNDIASIVAAFVVSIDHRLITRSCCTL